MKRITKQDAERKVGLVEKITVADDKLADAIRVFNDKQAVAFSEVQQVVVQYNDLIREAGGFCEDIAGEIESYINERSDAWREGEKGEAYNEWLGTWQDDLEEVEIDEPSAIDQPDTDAADRLCDLEEEVNV